MPAAALILRPVLQLSVVYASRPRLVGEEGCWRWQQRAGAGGAEAAQARPLGPGAAAGGASSMCLCSCVCMCACSSALLVLVGHCARLPRSWQAPTGASFAHECAPQLCATGVRGGVRCEPWQRARRSRVHDPEQPRNSENRVVGFRYHPMFRVCSWATWACRIIVLLAWHRPQALIRTLEV